MRFSEMSRRIVSLHPQSFSAGCHFLHNTNQRTNHLNLVGNVLRSTASLSTITPEQKCVKALVRSTHE